jgi:MFS transporter, SP family, galactose:H+ symporter
MPPVNDRPTFAIERIAFTAALCGLLFGYDTAVISGALLFLKNDFALSPLAQGLVASAVLAGAAPAAGFSGALVDRFGRKRLVIAVSILFFIASLATALAPTIAWLIAGRILVGVAIGICSYVGPLYISEIAPAERRGALVSLNQLLITVGILVSYLVDYLLAGGEHWRWMFAAAALPAAMLGVGMVFMPESPRWLVLQGRYAEAKEILLRVRSGERAVNEELGIVESVTIEKETAKTDNRWSTILDPRYRTAVILGIGLAIFQQVTGINTIIYYAPTIFQLAGFGSAAQSILATAGVGAVNVLMTVVSLRLLDRVGRRPLLLTGIAGMIVSLGILGFVFHFRNQSVAFAWMAVVSVMLYVGSFAISLGPIFWLLISEIYPLQVRGAAMGVATMANWGSNLIVALTFLTLVQQMGPANAFWLYGLISIGSFVFSYRLVPETKGRTLEEISERMERRGRVPQMGGG